MQITPSEDVWEGGASGKFVAAAARLVELVGNIDYGSESS